MTGMSPIQVNDMTDKKVVGINEEAEAAVKALDPDDVLESAKGQYSSVVIMGYDKDDMFTLRASANIRKVDINWMLDRAKVLIIGD